MLAGRAATEIIASDDYLGATIGFLVKNEIRVLIAIDVVTSLLESKNAETGPFDSSQV